MLATSQLTVGTKLKTTVEVGLWDESKYANRTHFEWPGETPPKETEGLPPLTQGDELIGGGYLPIDTVVTVQTILYHSSAYQCIRASADLPDSSGALQTQTGFLYTTHSGIDQVKLYVPPQPEPGPEPGPRPPEPGPEPRPQPPEPPGSQPGDVQIEVHAGQTVVVEVKSTTTATTSTGSLEVNLVDSNGNAVTLSPVYATGPGGTFEVVIDQNGHGKVDNLPAGTYTLSLQRSDQTGDGTQLPSKKLPPVVYFAQPNAVIDARGARAIEEAAEYLANPENSGITKVECRGFADDVGSQVYNDNLSLERAVAVKNELASKLTQATPGLEKSSAIGKNDLNAAPEQSNRVEFWVQTVLAAAEKTT